MKYRVHIYAVVRVPVEAEADSQVAAIAKAQAETDLYREFRQGEYAEAEEVMGFLVDQDGDTEYENSRLYKSDGKTLDIETSAIEQELIN